MIITLFKESYWRQFLKTIVVFLIMCAGNIGNKKQYIVWFGIASALGSTEIEDESMLNYIFYGFIIGSLVYSFHIRNVLLVVLASLISNNI